LNLSFYDLTRGFGIAMVDDIGAVCRFAEEMGKQVAHEINCLGQTVPRPSMEHYPAKLRFFAVQELGIKAFIPPNPD